MRYQRVGFGVVGAVALITLVLAGAAVWLFLTDPVTVATAVNEGDITPFVRDLAGVIVEALQALLRYF
jgi:hypothetical protein